MKISYLVLYTNDLDKTKSFYEGLGFRLTPESHGTGPLHYSCTLDSLVVELYPTRKSPTVTRIGVVHPALETLLSSRPDIHPNKLGNYEIKDPQGTTIEFLKNTPS
ncbi:MAG TPA: VOC family protein [Acidobacteriota bacterium]|nr:VOC family protein [Acidobacteriota bacterium]